MATLKEIKGQKIQSLDSDPVEYVGTWSSGGDLNQAKKQMGGAGLTPTSSIVFGGVQGSPPSLATTESYNGTSWTELNDMPQVTQYLAGMGTSTAAVAIAGIGGPADPPKGDYVQEWNGSSWSTNPNAYPFTAYSLAGAGTATAAIISGGDPARTDVNTFDGTSFTSSTAMNTGRRGHGSVGTTTANLVVGGETPRTANTEIWNGSSWTEVNNYPAATQDLSAWGTSTSAIGALGYDTANSANSASWDGTSWTETADLATARNGANRGGLGTNNTEGLVAGGEAPPVTTSTEEWGFPPPTSSILTEGRLWFNTASSSLKGYGTAAGIPAATWASGGDLNTARSAAGASGANNSGALVFGGVTNSVLTEQYNGTSWTEVNDLNADRQFMGGQGTSTLAIGFGGEEPGLTGKTELWDGTNWTEVNDMNTARYTLGSGTQSYTVGLAVGGWLIPGVSPAVESFDGTSWTELAEMNTARNGPFLSGDSSNAICSGGSVEPGVQVLAEVWNGSSWTETADLNTARYNGGSAGTYTNALIFGGSNQAGTVDAETEFWNGTAWTELNDLSTARNYQDGAGAASVNAILAGGSSPPNVASTEEWTADASVSTVTTS